MEGWIVPLAIALFALAVAGLFAWLLQQRRRVRERRDRLGMGRPPAPRAGRRPRGSDR